MMFAVAISFLACVITNYVMPNRLATDVTGLVT